ncbi:C6 zinc finger domain protein [Aspergillus ellipticus CBS 707.79]|uniref:C6 zinc finger domain protein n=1 Tax=Aspergillus ellipticus CBS 707.79 TaxID=1448320 RepID=A0A319DMT1_9EURO|nr:C6 zinc finger domain protein [Aspergillus ellipticus CBS 707.79]
MPVMTLLRDDHTPANVSDTSSERDGFSPTESRKMSSRQSNVQTTGQPLPPPPSQPTAEGEYRCGICNKTYSRRDLRDRHRRRCIKNIGQERQSKRKSCDACAQKKLRCSMNRPSCSRCLQSRRPCVYPQSSVPVQAPNLLSDPQETSNSPTSSVPVCASLIPGSTPWVLSAHQFDTPGFDEANEVPSASWSPDASSTELAVHTIADSNLLPMQDVSMLNSPPWHDDFHEQNEPFGLDDCFHGSLDSSSSRSSQILYMSHHGTMESSPAAVVPPTPAAFPGDSYTMARGTAVASMSSGYFDNHWSDAMPPSDDDDTWRLNIYPDSLIGSVFGHNFLPKTTHQTPGDISDVYQEMFSLLREYPGLVLQRQFYSPFLHHQMYRCAMQSMGEPLGASLASITSYASYLESCDTFDHTMHTEERLAVAPDSCVAAFHAVCVYQILSIFGANPPSNTINKLQGLDEEDAHHDKEYGLISETPIAFLLKMIQRVYKLHEDILRTPHEDESNWSRWKFTESLRRNIFFANIISTLASKTRKFNGIHFDPLDNVMLLQLPLPAPEEMWQARSEEEWMNARAQTLRSWTRALDGNMLPAPRTLQQLLIWEEVGSVTVTLLLPITRMILACAKLSGQASYG